MTTALKCNGPNHEDAPRLTIEENAFGWWRVDKVRPTYELGEGPTDELHFCSLKCGADWFTVKQG